MTAGAEWSLVGRDRELREVGEALRERSVVVVAPAGAGKSRLAREVVAVEAAAGALTGWVQATRSAASIPLGAFADLLPEDTRGDGLMRRSLEALRVRSNGRRIVVGVDDAQLLDPVSAALVAHLASQDVRIVATVRTGAPLPLDDAHLVELGPLSRGAVDALVEARLGGPAEEEVLHWVAESSQGNALYAHELVAGVLDSGALIESDGLWRLIGKPSVSTSLTELIAARLAHRSEPLELLAVGEPLHVDELLTLTTPEALRDVEARGLMVLDSSAQARLAHPLFGEVVAGALPSLRARLLRLRLAETLQRRSPLSPDDVLRIARLLTDAGGEIPAALRLDAARAATLAGDPDLGAQLAAPALGEPGLAAALILSRAHMQRNLAEEAEAVLGSVEERAPGDPQAFEYLTQRAWNLAWGLHRVDTAVALLDRARGWSDDPDWVAWVTEGRRLQVSVGQGFSAEVTANVDVVEDGSMREAFTAMTALFSGDGTTAAAISHRIRPQVPLRSLAEAPALATSAIVPLETGIDWPDVEAFMTAALPAAVRGRDHEAAGAAAFTLGSLHVMRGRYRDASRRLAEAQRHHQRHDTVGALVYVHAFQVAVAAATGDFDASTAGLARIDAALDGREALPTQVPFILRAQGWAARLRGDHEAIEVFNAGAERLAHLPVFSASLRYEALRAGAQVAPELREAAGRCRARLVAAYLAHAEARERADGPALEAAAEDFVSIGALRYGLEAMAEAAARFLEQGRQDSARRAGRRALELHPPGQGTDPPVIDGLEGPAAGLTPRESQIAGLVRSGLTNAEIAERLGLSVRTVKSHIYHAMVKLDAHDRREL